MYLLDTDHLVILQRESEPEFTRLVERLDACKQSEFFLSATSFHEQMLGANSLISRAKSQEQVVRGYELLQQVLIYYSKFVVLPFDQAAAALFVQLRTARVRIGTMDLRIAATALSGNMTLLSRNTKDFGQVPGLLLEDWTS